MTDCIFCSIIAGDIPANIVYRDDQMTVFHDIHPRARVHLLAIPNQHIDSLATLSADDAALMGAMVTRIPSIAREQGLEDGFRTVVNTGAGGGQEVDHIHFHILGDIRDPEWRGF
jgi:histidine triad (HIT) family protein